MTVAEFRQSLAKFDKNVENYEIIIYSLGANGEREYNLLSYVGYFDHKDIKAIAIGDEKTALELVKTQNTKN